MRLIDADALVARYGEPCHSFLDVIEDMPTIDAEPVRRGEWVEVRTSVFTPYALELEEKCSLCGRYIYRYGTQPPDRYCPNCGAKMDRRWERERTAL